MAEGGLEGVAPRKEAAVSPTRGLLPLDLGWQPVSEPRVVCAPVTKRRGVVSADGDYGPVGSPALPARVSVRQDRHAVVADHPEGYVRCASGQAVRRGAQALLERDVAQELEIFAAAHGSTGHEVIGDLDGPRGGRELGQGVAADAGRATGDVREAGAHGGVGEDTES